jgi:cyclophilin family peptidyl-prolyl cis-trans isomerase
MSKRSRERQLAKLAARRQAERDAIRRRRERALTVGITVVVAAAVVAGGVWLLGRGGGEEASATPTPSASPTPSLGVQTGTVNPKPAPTKVACGAAAPATAGKPKPQFSGVPTDVIDRGKRYVATLDTSCGAIRIQLGATTAPQTVASFVFLARKHYFDGQYFHRLDTSIDVIQGGDPTGTGSGGPGYTIPDEATGNESYGPGALAMANSGQPDSGGSQFFIITGPNGHNLDDNPAYTIFGQVVGGMDVAKRIQKLPIEDPTGGISGQRPTMAVYINKVRITAS